MFHLTPKPNISPAKASTQMERKESVAEASEVPPSRQVSSSPSLSFTSISPPNHHPRASATVLLAEICTRCPCSHCPCSSSRLVCFICSLQICLPSLLPSQIRRPGRCSPTRASLGQSSAPTLTWSPPKSTTPPLDALLTCLPTRATLSSPRRMADDYV
jgi:hypothetical protein